MSGLPFDARDRIERVLRDSLPLEPAPRILGIASRIMTALAPPSAPRPLCSCTRSWDGASIVVKHYDCPVHGDLAVAADGGEGRD